MRLQTVLLQTVMFLLSHRHLPLVVMLVVMEVREARSQNRFLSSIQSGGRIFRD